MPIFGKQPLTLCKIIMKEQDIVALLESHDIKPTANRIVVAKVLYASMMPMSMTELENKILTIDKSNIFRTLTLFKSNHLVHVIEDGSGGVKYELCHSHHEVVDDDMHAHFHCEVCGRTFCLDHVPIPMIEMPDGYMVNTVNYLVKGICPACKEKC